MPGLSLSPLDRAHRALNAKMVEFGGWDMPVAYPTGTIAEHLACRSSAVVFDVSHLGTVRIEGYYAKAALQGVLTNDLDKIEVGRAQYTHLLNGQGCVLDDIIVWWIKEDRFDVMPNASNTDRVVSAIGGVDVTTTRAVLAVQGPKAKDFLATINKEFADIKKFSVKQINWRGVECIVAGTFMVEPTESETIGELDRFCNAMIAIYLEIQQIAENKISHEDSPLHNAPHTVEDLCGVWNRKYSQLQAAYPTSAMRGRGYFAPVSRIDAAYGDRNLICSCDPFGAPATAPTLV